MPSNNVLDVVGAWLNKQAEEYRKPLTNPPETSRSTASMASEGLSMAPAGIIVGEKALGVSLKMLDKAKTMAVRGSTQDEIYNATGSMSHGHTGWWQNALDKVWRTEVPLATTPKLYSGAPLPLTPDRAFNWKDVFQPNRLNQMYPEIGTRDVSGLPSTSQSRGGFNPQNLSFRFNPAVVAGKPDTFSGVITHEAQHYIQNVEGMIGGSSPNAFLPKDFAAVKSGWQSIARSAEAQLVPELSKLNEASRMQISKETIKQLAINPNARAIGLPAHINPTALLTHVEALPGGADYIAATRVSAKLGNTFDKAAGNYRKVLGEADARAAQLRDKIGMTLEERMATPLYKRGPKGYDVNPESVTFQPEPK